MRLVVGAIAAALALGACAPVQQPAQGSQAAATKQVFVTRHLQKAAGDDPPLTAEGAANAQRLAAMLVDKGITAVFATPTRRAMETAAPLASRLGIAVTPYDPRDSDGLAAAVAASHGSVLVVGHSNTVPELVSRLGGGPQPPMSEQDYGRLFVIGPGGLVEILEVR